MSITNHVTVFQVIFSVYQEKERNWEKELRKIKAIYDNRLKASQQRALKMEQMLTMQTYQVSFSPAAHLKQSSSC